MDFGLFWKFHYLLNRARKPLKMGWEVLSQLLETLLLIPHSPMFGPTVMIMMMIMMIVMMIMMMIMMIMMMMIMLSIIVALGKNSVENEDDKRQWPLRQ